MYLLKLSNYKNAAGTLALAAALPLVLTGCQDEEFGYTAEQIKYSKNFEATYGVISPDQEWDFSSSAGWEDPSFDLTTRANGSGVPTTGLTKSTDQSGHFSVKEGYWEVPKSLLQWLETYLVEGHDNRYLGSNFILQMPKNDFAIIPIYQGASAIMSELEMKVNGYAITNIWTKSDGIQVIDKNYSNWTNLGYFDGRTQYDVYEEKGRARAAETLEVDRLQSKPIYFRHSKIGDDKYMYLSLHNIAKIRWGNGDNDIWDKENSWTTIGHRLTSINSKGHMLALNIPWDERPSLDALPKISEEGKNPSEMLIIGCEDAEGNGTDHDVNDVVFMIIGYPNVPKVIPATEVIKKRYMCEDLGATDDFDFNDIVVDVTQTMDYQLSTNPEEDKDSYDATSVEITGMTAIESTKKQTAKISHVCGTLPFQVQVGDYVFPKVTDPENKYSTRRELWASGGATRATEVVGNGWNPNEMKEITGWNPKTNNIRIYVSGWKGVIGDVVSNVYNGDSKTDEFADFSTGTYKVVTFSRPGTVPFIIATDQDVPWMSERADIPEEWLSGDMTARTNKNGESTADAGSSLYYTSSTGDSNGYEDEAVIWTGSVTGSKDVGGLKMPEGSPEYQAFIDAKNANYNVINIYGTKKAGGKCGLKLGDGTMRKLDVPDGSRDINTGEDADYFYQPTDATNGQICVTRIVLTDRELQMLGIRGLFVSLGLDGMEITKVSMSRGARIDNQTKKADFYDVYLSAPTGGAITAADRERQAMKMGVDEATGKAQYEEENSDRLRVPFTHSRYLNDVAQGQQTVTLTAVADEGYRFTQWSDGNTNATRTITPTDNPSTSNAPLTAIFEKLYRVYFVPQNDPGDGSAYKYDLGGKCHLQIVRGSSSPVQDEIYAAVGDVLELTPIPCDGYEFVQWWENYSVIPRQYTVVSPTDGSTDLPVYGVFKKKSYTITLHPDNGCIAYISKIDGVAVEGKTTTTGTFKHGTVLTLMAEAKDGYTFVGWSSGDTAPERTLTLTADAGPYATSERTKYDLTMSPLTDDDKNGYTYTNDQNEVKFRLANKYCDNWTKVDASNIGYTLSDALNEGKNLRFIMDFNGEGRGYNPYAAYLGSKKNQTVGNEDHAFDLMLNQQPGNNCTFEDNILTFVLAKTEFDQYFMRVINGNPTELSDLYFGFWNFLPASIKVQVVD